jgi:hypothetical protein
VRGARQGLRRAEWILEPSPALGQLADLTRVPPAERLERVRAIERELGLRRLSRFLERIAVQPA